MVAGLENWRVFPEMEIDEPRLCAILGVSKLYTPPGGEVAGMLPMVRFPEWVSCPKCNRLDRFWKLADKPKETYENRCRHCLTVRLVPSRFVACCAAGHIQDFPYRYWVHQGAASAESDHTLRIATNPADGSLGGITIKCSCGAEARKPCGCVRVWGCMSAVSWTRHQAVARAGADVLRQKLFRSAARGAFAM